MVILTKIFRWSYINQNFVVSTKTVFPSIYSVCMNFLSLWYLSDLNIACLWFGNDIVTPYVYKYIYTYNFRFNEDYYKDYFEVTFEVTKIILKFFQLDVIYINGCKLIVFKVKWLRIFYYSLFYDYGVSFSIHCN